MIEAREFRLGNYYLGFDNKAHQVDLRFFELLADGIECDEIIKSCIPLTEKWLLKAGFIETYKSHYGHSFELETDSRIGVKFYLTEGRTMFRFIGETLPIQHLHHLQNLTHALIGTELTFDETTPPTE